MIVNSLQRYNFFLNHTSLCHTKLCHTSLCYLYTADNQLYESFIFFKKIFFYRKKHKHRRYFYRVWRKIFTEFGGNSCKNICYYEQKARKTTFTDIQLLTISFKAFGGKFLRRLAVLLPSLAGIFYRVWRKYLPRTSTDVHGNTVYKSKYVNTSKNMFCSASRTLFVPT